MPVPGFSLLSPQAGDALCLATHGPGWRMAEFHDGWGWGLRAFGNVREDTRFWVRINDQKANCWNSAPLVESEPADGSTRSPR